VKEVQKTVCWLARKRILNKFRIIDIWRNEINEKEFLIKLKNVQIIFILIEVIVFVSFAQKIFSKILFEKDVIKFHINSIKSRSITQKREKQWYVCEFFQVKLSSRTRSKSSSWWIKKQKLMWWLNVDTLVRRWISSSNQRWVARHYLLTRLAHSTRLIIIILIWWLDESFQLTIHSRIDDHLIDHIISRLYLMTFNDYVTNRVFSMWARYLICEEIENHLYKTLCNHLIKSFIIYNSSIDVIIDTTSDVTSLNEFTLIN
jgi:hypothetical protein